MALPQEPLFVTIDYLKKLTPVNGAVDENLIKPCLYVAQDRWVRPFIGDALWAKLITELPTPAGNYATLIEQYMAKPVVFWTLVELMPKMMYKYNDGTMGQHNSEDYTPISDSAMKDELERAKKHALAYSQGLVKYLCENRSLFPEYGTETGGQRCPITTVYNRSTFMFTTTQDARGRRPIVNINRLP